MAAVFVGLLLLLAMFAHSDASFCVCNSGLSDSVLQKNIDYACGNGADCTSISQNGPCYNPNTVKDHCNYAVNSYYQRKGQIPGSCDFQGTATVTQTAPSASSGCVFQSSPSNGGSTTPSTNPTTPTTGAPPSAGGTPVGGAPNTGTPVGGAPNIGTPVGGTPNTGTPIGGTPNTGGTPVGGTPMAGGTNPGTLPGSVSPTIGLGPTGSGFGNTDGSNSVKLSSQSSIIFVLMSFLSLLASSLVL